MTADDALLEETAEELFEDAPCGYVTTRLDGTIVKVNRTFEAWTGLRREDLVGGRRLQDLLSVGGRIYFETHVAPLLRMQQAVREIAVEVVRADGTRLPALVNAVLRTDAEGRPGVIRDTVFDATDRRRYEQELLAATRREQETALRLQRSLLAGALPTADGLEVEVAYRPAIRGTEVGGDWYDAFWLDDGETLALCVGDVVGRGIEAAATMGQLRSAVRALASMRLGPARLLEGVDAFARRHGVGQMTTLVYAELDVGSGWLSYACAGHPPPVLVRPGDPPSLAWEGRSLPLDAFTNQGRRRLEARAHLAPGSAVLLYSDGLIESRDHDLDEGFDRLMGLVDAHRADEASALAAALVHVLHDPAHADDMCLLVARLGAADAQPALSAR